MTHTIHDKIRLARNFGSQVQGLGRADFQQVVDRNKAETSPGICHSHDFCDANMLMEEAFRETFGREFLPDEGEPADDDLLAWNEAWSIAVAAEFFA